MVQHFQLTPDVDVPMGENELEDELDAIMQGSEKRDLPQVPPWPTSANKSRRTIHASPSRESGNALLIEDRF